MSVFDMVLLYWVVPGLMTLLVMMQLCREGGQTPDSYSQSDWGWGVLSIILWPLVLAGLLTSWLSDEIWPLLIKER